MLPSFQQSVSAPVCLRIQRRSTQNTILTIKVWFTSEMFLPSCWVFCLALWTLAMASSSCPSQCRCFYHNLGDGSKTRSVICNDPEISLVPANFPVDAYKLRIEKTAIKRIPSEAFNYLPNLEFLWISFNSVSLISLYSFRGLTGLDELRLDGNSISLFPWQSLMDMPKLRLLDLHNNKITAIGPEAAVYIKNLTYLDLSSNNLLTLPSEVLSSWLPTKPTQGADNSKIILGLHDNPWVCDCRLYDLVKFQKSVPSLATLIDIRLRCSEPESLSGVQFSDADLRRCQRPEIHSAVGRIRSTVGNNILLRCGSSGVPTPELSWSRADSKQINGTAQQELSKEGIIWSILSVHAVSYENSGKYICKATNFAGSSEAVVLLVIIDRPQSRNQNDSSRNHFVKEPVIVENRFYEETVSGDVQPVTAPLHDPALYPGSESHTGSNSPKAWQTSSPAISEEVPKIYWSGDTPNSSSSQHGLGILVRSVKVVQHTDHTVSLNWKASGMKNTTVFTVLYAIFGQRDMHKINVGPGKKRITIEGLVPKTKYIACVSVKGLIPKKDQCVIFSTDKAAGVDGTQKLINVVVVTTACMIAVPLIVIVCSGGLKRCCNKVQRRTSKDTEHDYVTFQALPPACKAKGLESQYITTLNLADSKRLISTTCGLINTH